MFAIRVVAIACLILLSVRTATRGAEPATQGSPETEALIRQLSADDFHQRQAAQDQLVSMGDAARERLQRAAHEAADEETRTRAEAALAQIAENSTVGPSYITLHLKDAPPAELFKQLSRQCGVSLDSSKPDFWDNKKIPSAVSIDIDRQPFWNAMQQITELTGIELRPEDGGMKLNAGKQADAVGERYVTGPFLIVANSIMRNRVVMLGNNGAGGKGNVGPAPSSTFMIAMTAFAEPKMRVLGSTAVARLDQAIDENGNSLMPPVVVEKKTPITDATSGRWIFRVLLEY